MTEQAREKTDHRARHPGHFDEEAEEDEQGHGEQDEVAHPLVHSTDDDERRYAGRERDIAEGGKPKCEGDRYAGKDERADETDEEQQQVIVAEFWKHATCGVECADDRRYRQDRKTAR